MIEKNGAEVMEQLIDAYHNVAASPELRELIRQRERAKHNEASALANAEQKGRAKGRKEGLAEGLAEGRQEGEMKGRAEAQQDFVRTMYKGGFTVAEDRSGYRTLGKGSQQDFGSIGSEVMEQLAEPYRNVTAANQ